MRVPALPMMVLNVVFVVILMVAKDCLPERIATHFDVSGLPMGGWCARPI